MISCSELFCSLALSLSMRFVLILLANFLLMRLLMPSPEAPVTVPYTLFKEEVKKGNVQAIFSRSDTIRGRFAAPVTYPPPGEQSAAEVRKSGVLHHQGSTDCTSRSLGRPRFRKVREKMGHPAVFKTIQSSAAGGQQQVPRGFAARNDKAVMCWGAPIDPGTGSAT